MRILHSTSRSALREKCLREVCEQTAAWPDRRAILLVPEQAKMDMERDYLAISGQSGLMMAEVLSFRRLAWRLLGEIGRQPSQTIDSIGQSMLIHRILRQNQADLHSFGHLADKPGFIKQAAAALGDLKRYQIDGALLLAAGENAGDKALQNKTHDLGILLQQYDNSLQESGLSDAEDELNRLAELLQVLCGLSQDQWPWPWQKLSWLRRTSIWISGFGELRDFTPQEDTILLALHQITEQMTLTVAADQIPFDWQAIDNGPDYFLPGRKTAWRLLQRVPSHQIERIPEALAGYPARIAASLREGQACPPENVPGDPRPGEPVQPNYLRLISANSRDAELAWVAGEIRRLVQLEGYRYQDITLAMCDLGSYLPRLRATCREYGIPLFLNAERPLSGTPLLRFILGLLDIGIYNWTPSAVMNCLRSGLTPLASDAIDRLENEMLAKASFRPDRLFDDTRFNDESLRQIRDEAFNPFKAVLEELKLSIDARSKCFTLNRFFQTYELQARMEKRSAELISQNEMDAAVALVQAWNELQHIFGQMIRLNGDSAMSLSIFRDSLAAGMDAANSIVIPSAIDQVVVGDLKRAILRQTRVLFLVGCTAASLPPPLPPEGLLKDQDRQSLSGILERQLPSSARDQVFADAFVTYTLLTLPTERLCLTAPEMAVSPWFKWLSQSQTGRIEQLSELPSAGDVRMNAVRPAFSFLLGYCSRLRSPLPDPVDAADWLALVRVLAAADMPINAAADWLRHFKQASGQMAVQIPSALVRALYADPIAMSVSQLEKYASCPYLHLASYLLSLQERPVWAPEVAETGTLLHGIVELALQELQTELTVADVADPAIRQQILGQWLTSDLDRRTLAWMKAAARESGLEIFFDQGLQASIGRRVKRLAATSLQAILRQFQQAEYLPAYFEWSFGPNKTAGLPLQLPDGTRIAFRGKVDRVDLLNGPEGAHFRIIDYKSGNKKPEYNELYHGLSLQLPAYLVAFNRNNPDCQPDDAAYFHFDRPILSLINGKKPTPEQQAAELNKRFKLNGFQMEPDQLRRLCRHTIRQAARLAENLLKGNFDVAPGKFPGQAAACEYCTMQAICGFDDDPSHYRWLQPLRCRRKENGKKAKTKEEFNLRLQEQDAAEGGSADAAHT